MALRVGLLDSGVEPALARSLAAARDFTAGPGGVPGAADATGHGSAVARAVIGHAPSCRLAVARVFARSHRAAPAAVAAGLDWLAGEGVALACMSFGLRRDREVLREACARALAAGIVLVAAAPARGAAVYPAAYPGVLRATGDARCAPGEISALGTAQADYGACPRAGPVRGASAGCAHLAGVAAAWLAAGGERAGLRAHLERIARYRGPERRGSA